MINLTAKIITTETAEIVGAAKASFKNDKMAEDLLSQTTQNPSTRGSETPKEDSAKVVKTLGDLRVELRSLKAVGGRDMLLSMSLVNQNPRKSLWTALNTDTLFHLKASLTDSNGMQFRCPVNNVSGIAATSYARYGYQQRPGLSPATEIKPREATFVTLKFTPDDTARLTLGTYSVQLEFLLGCDVGGINAKVNTQNVVTKINAEQ